MTFTEHAIMLLDELSKKLIAFLPESNDLVMESFLDLFVSVVRVNILADRVSPQTVPMDTNLVDTLFQCGVIWDLYFRTGETPFGYAD
jgi:hypothetical protein